MKQTAEKIQLEPNSRRVFLKAGLASGAALASGLSFAQEPVTSSTNSTPETASNNPNRATAAFDLRKRAAQEHYENSLLLDKQADNGDEKRYKADRYYASFSKTLPCNRFGEVNPSAFLKLKRAMKRGGKKQFDKIPLASQASRKLANPQGAFKYELSGLDCHATRIEPSHRFRSAEIAAEVAEVYWQAITRDIAYTDYENNNLVHSAIQDLNQFSYQVAPLNGPITSTTLFRGETLGDLNGPYISQFLWQDFNFGPVEVTQLYRAPTPDVNFMADSVNWLNIQRGGTPLELLTFDSNKRYIYNNRTLGEYVHQDVSFQAYLHAAMILLSYGKDALDSTNPYKESIDNQSSFTSLGAPFILDMVTKAANLSLTGAWFQKWKAHRYLRPETFSGRIHFHIEGQRQYELHTDILNSRALAEVYSRYGSYFLPQAYTEGSPTHPSYPAGHATIAGACVTVLKAFFNEAYVIPNPVEANNTGEQLNSYTGSDLSVGDELNKLASNISLGRDAAGVHYRQDGIQGLLSGEQQAIALLQDQSLTLNESDFDGFTFTKFNGDFIKIKQGKITPA